VYSTVGVRHLIARSVSGSGYLFVLAFFGCQHEIIINQLIWAKVGSFSMVYVFSVGHCALTVMILLNVTDKLVRTVVFLR